MALRSITAITGYWDEALAVGLGIVVVDLISDKISAFLGKWIPAKWVDVAAEGVIGIGIFAIGEILAPIAWKTYTRLASFGALGLAVSHAVKVLLGGMSSSSSSEGTHASSTLWPFV